MHLFLGRKKWDNDNYVNYLARLNGNDIMP